MNEYESQASFSSSRDTGLVIEPTSRRPPSPVNEQQARLVAKLLNIDRLAGYSFGKVFLNKTIFNVIYRRRGFPS